MIVSKLLYDEPPLLSKYSCIKKLRLSHKKIKLAISNKIYCIYTVYIKVVVIIYIKYNKITLKVMPLINLELIIIYYFVAGGNSVSTKVDFMLKLG